MPAKSQLPPDDDDLQFEVAEPIESAPTPTVQACIACHRPIKSTYYAIRDKILCPTCCQQVQVPPKGSKFGRFAKSAIFGLGAGLVGTLIWFLIRRFAHVEIGLVAVLVGFMVGKAVRKGSANRGGRGYQVLALVLTYCCIAANYMPDILEQLVTDIHARHSQTDTSQSSANNTSNTGNSANSSNSSSNATPHAKPNVLKMIGAVILVAVIVFALSLAAPFFAGVQNLIGLLIIGFALWEAWKLNAYRKLPITGPYQLGAGQGGTVSGVVV